MPEIDLPTVIFALVALFVAWKLRSVLGMRQDSDRPGELAAPLAPRSGLRHRPRRPAGRRRPRRRFRWLPRIAGKASPSPILPSGAVSTPLPAADRSFSPQAFLAGARGAYDMVVHAFAAGNSDALKSLMSPEAFANFESAIHARADAGHTMSTTVVSIDNATIVGAALVGPTAQTQRAVLRQARFRDPRRSRRSRRRVAQHGRRSYRLVDVRARCSLSRSQLAADGDRVGELSRAATLSKLRAAPPRAFGFRKPRGLESMTTIRRRFALSSARRGRLSADQTSPRPAQSAPPELMVNARAALCGAAAARRAHDFSRRGFDPSASFPRTAGDS